MTGYNPGDVVVDNLLVNAPYSGGTRNYTTLMLTSSVLETIFTAGVSAEIQVMDYNDWLGTLQLQGNETVYFQFTKANGMTMEYNFHLNKITELEIKGSMKAKAYNLSCISQEVIKGRLVNVQRAYNAPISSIVPDVFSLLNSPLSIEVETTKGNRNLKLANQTVYEAIEMLRKEAVSNGYQSSNYMFWQTSYGFHFKTLEAMLQSGDVKYLKQDYTVGASINKSIDDNILAWKIVQNFDAMSRAKAGVVNQRIAFFDTNTLSYRIVDFNDLLGTGEMGTPLNYGIFRTIFGGTDSARAVFRVGNPNQKTNIPQSHMPSSIPYKQLNLAQMQEQMMRMTVIGDPVLQAGTTVFCDVPKITASTDNVGSKEVQMYGRWLISKVEHEIRLAGNLPRYLCNLECLKGAYE